VLQAEIRSGSLSAEIKNTLSLVLCDHYTMQRNLFPCGVCGAVSPVAWIPNRQD
jgi:hypothetical protein